MAGKCSYSLIARDVVDDSRVLQHLSEAFEYELGGVTHYEWKLHKKGEVIELPSQDWELDRDFVGIYAYGR